jgi:hypothetical protein
MSATTALEHAACVTGLHCVGQGCVGKGGKTLNILCPLAMWMETEDACCPE